MHPMTWQLKVTRAALFTALCLTLSATSHVTLSRTPLPPATLGLAAAGVFAMAFTLAGRERGFGQIAAVLIPLELAVDFLFTQGQQSCYGAYGGPLTGPWRSVTGLVLCGNGDLAISPGPATGLTGLGPASPWLLLAAHLLVGLLAAGWLRRGEAAAFRVLRCMAAQALAPLRLVWRAAPAAPLVLSVSGATSARPPLIGATVRYSVVRRGPPSLALAC